ncbi:hypothetical protein SGR_173 [Streptomyces griseus subsp. griseus NBRC 13350]|uniref:Uncharacterized protein n=1 Tax=Streptomyces griseus subsp. griseus (strain JCM 4626 / CBS 651.72 / NBRC 13350 / KCC S-0626 / ISP 5235) TaxID=455632 RepID=B1VNH9_STRGG|nr:hypothetical protein SGR_173 [Streptomyces griseus subsp. griseus NBRC 13350]
MDRKITGHSVLGASQRCYGMHGHFGAYRWDISTQAVVATKFRAMPVGMMRKSACLVTTRAAVHGRTPTQRRTPFDDVSPDRSPLLNIFL